MSGANKAGPACTVPESFANLSDETRQVGVGDERRRPKTFVQLVFRKNTRTVVDEDFEEVESLGRQMHLRSAAKKLSGVRVERHLPKTEFHNRCLAKRHKYASLPKTLPPSPFILIAKRNN